MGQSAPIWQNTHTVLQNCRHRRQSDLRKLKVSQPQSWLSFPFLDFLCASRGAACAVGGGGAQTGKNQNSTVLPNLSRFPVTDCGNIRPKYHVLPRRWHQPFFYVSSLGPSGFFQRFGWQRLDILRCLLADLILLVKTFVSSLVWAASGTPEIAEEKSNSLTEMMTAGHF